MCLAVPGKIVEIFDRPQDDYPNPETPRDVDLFRSGKVSFAGILKTVNLAYVPEAQVGDYVIVHTGFALTVLDQSEAEQTLKDLNQILPQVS